MDIREAGEDVDVPSRENGRASPVPLEARGSLRTFSAVFSVMLDRLALSDSPHFQGNMLVTGIPFDTSYSVAWAIIQGLILVMRAPVVRIWKLDVAVSPLNFVASASWSQTKRPPKPSFEASTFP